MPIDFQVLVADGLSVWGEQCTDFVVDYMIRVAEVDGDGQVYSELDHQGPVAVAGVFVDNQCVHEDCVFDYDESVPEGCERIEAFSGFITAEQLRLGMMFLGEQPTAFELDEIIRAADVDGNGLIYYEELYAATAGLCGDVGS